ncbi:Cellulose synthase [Cynara cardunculus var. scolymus]|uniref:Cellulose synthase n=1 Tax=Cynara cardunculus var. scolymus TaxID=59895 RepID=A0A103XJJ5_CYNCS|nr:Cellulose synthase [Cynara cardunculus var. scolymus]
MGGGHLHTYKHVPCTHFNRVFAIIYTCAILSLLHHHFLTLLRHSTTVVSATITASFLISDLILAFMWATTTSFRLRPILRETYPENLEEVVDRTDFPAMDIFICTADPYKEPPMNVTNTALSLMAYDYPPEKISVYVIYEGMKIRVENVVERGEVSPEYITTELQRQAFNKYRTPGFSQSVKEKDKMGNSMPNLVYVSREKNKNSPHHFKAGALNSLLRVSGVMTNAPIVLTQDCDMYSNDPQTPKRALCYICDPLVRPELGYVQFPQRYHGLNKDDIYGGEFLRLFVANPVGTDGLQGPSYVGSGCFFLRRAFFGGPTSKVSPEIQELRPDHVVETSFTMQPIMELAHYVAGCNYENNTKWGSQLGFQYGSLVEDYFTGYRLQCEGWESVFCHPSRPAFLGDIPISLIDAISQTRRWAIGLLEVGLSKYVPVIYGSRSMGPIMGFCYAHYAFWAILSIPITLYSFIPQIALLNGLYIFPKHTCKIVMTSSYSVPLLKDGGTIKGYG